MNSGAKQTLDGTTVAVDPCMHGSPRQQHAHRHTRDEPAASQQLDPALQRPDGILALLTAALAVPPQSIQSSMQGQLPLQGQDLPTPAAKKPRLDMHNNSDLSALTVKPQPSQDYFTLQLQQQVEQMQGTFWQRAWQGVQFYLGLSTQQEQDDTGTYACWEADFPPITGLSPQESQALRQLMEPVRHAEVAKTRELLARLQGLDSAALAPPAAAAAPAPAAAQAPASSPLQAARLSSRPGLPSAGLASASVVAAAAGENVAAADAVAAAAAMNQEQEHVQEQRQQSPGAATAAWLAAQPDMQAWAGSWEFPAVHAMYAMNEAPARRRGLPQPVGVAAARQQPWGATQVSSAGGGVLGGASSSTGQEGFSLRNPQYVGVYRSRRTEQGWRAQFSYANKVVNLGTYDEAEDAARVWNEAALLLRGEGTWLNPVQPVLPEGYAHGELHLSSQKAVAAVQAAAAAAGLPDAVVRGVKLMAV